MRRRDFLLTAAALAALAAACARRGRIVPIPGPQRGIGFDPFRAPTPTPADFAAIRSLGATHLALFSFAYMPSHMEPQVLRYVGDGIDWSLTDEGLLSMGRMARGAGLRVILIPTLADFVDGHWRGEVRMTDEASWAAWFSSYRLFIYHYARLADAMGAVGLSVGTELRETVGHEDEWRETIAMVREGFRGWLTYAANWDDYDRVPWWDAVDLIGVQAYFELGDPASTTPYAARRQQLIDAWEPIKQQLARVSASTGKRVLFTEIGYKSHVGATAYPWKWEIEGTTDLEIQQAAYEAAFEIFWREAWFAGFYWWKWRPAGVLRGDDVRDFTPQGKPAESVIRKYYSGETRR